MTKRRSTNTGIPGLSFSWRRALGVSQAQVRLSRNIGIPLSRSGLQQEVARSLGCWWIFLVVPVVVVLVLVLVLVRLLG